MAQLEGPCPPGDYQVVVVGSGPGGLQLSYHLGKLGIRHAVISSDDSPGGMFRRFPTFQRLITWSKPHAPVDSSAEHYEWYDWNSLLAEEPGIRNLTPRFMDGISYFPAREEMEKQLVHFTESAQIRCRYSCIWESTRRTDEGRFVLTTSDGEYHCDVAVIATGMSVPWRPSGVEGIEDVPHYVDVVSRERYEGRRVFIIGKRNSGFELADGLLPWASQLILASPRPVRMSVMVRSSSAARARYIQPYEDHLLGGGNLLVDATIERIERSGEGFKVYAHGTTTPGDLVFEVDDVIAATGFTAPLADLRNLGLKTFYQDRLPSQSPFWESTTLPGIHFAGTLTQGSIGLKKYGNPSGSAAVHGFRYNARLLARHLGESRFGVKLRKPDVAPPDAVDHLLACATRAPDLWNQQSYLARVIAHRNDGMFVDAGAIPLAHFVDSYDRDSVAIAVETDPEGDIHPAVYIRRSGEVSEHLLPSAHAHDYMTKAHRSQLGALLDGWI